MQSSKKLPKGQLNYPISTSEITDFSDTSYASPIDTDSLLIKDVTNSLWKRLTWANLKTLLLNANVLRKVINDTTASANQTLTTEVVMKTYEITGGTFVSGSKPNITIGSTKTSGLNAAYTMRLYAGSTNVFASATLIGTYATTSAFIRGFNFERRSFYFDGTTLNGYVPSSAVITDIGQVATATWGGMTLNPANSIYIFVTLQNGSASDTTRIDYVNITE